MTPTPLAVRARKLVKRYGTFAAVDGIDLEVPTGGCFGVLGPNGAGKTTTMRMITCTSPVTEGSLEVLGESVGGDRRALKRRLGVVPQGETLDADLPVRENLTTFARYHAVPRDVAARRADELLDFVSLTDRAGAKVEELSGGMRRRLLIARALVNDPEMVVLDEPTTGLDPQARHHVWERLRGLKRRGVTLLLTTHYMEEAAQLCDSLVIMDRGRIVAEGPPAALVRRHTAPRVVEVQGVADGGAAVRAILDGSASDIEEVGDRILIYTTDAQEVSTRLRDARIPDVALLERAATLEDVFLRLTGHALID